MASFKSYTLADVQKEVRLLLDQVTPREELMPWTVGNIPRHYKRLNISLEKALELAKFGQKDALVYFNTKLHFTQALIYGAVLSKEYRKFYVITTPSYGKSFVSAMIAIRMAYEGEPVFVAGTTKSITDVIMQMVQQRMKYTSKEIQAKALDAPTKIDKLEASLSKKRLSWRGGGSIEGITLGETFAGSDDRHIKNAAIGRSGNIILDEASQASDDTYVELGRAETGAMGDKSYFMFEISNPHAPGRFYDKMCADKVPPKTLIVWMDVRTSIEEGRLESKESILDLEFYHNRSSCKRYLLCELDNYLEQSLFGEPVVDDSPIKCTSYYLGIDGAYKGPDKIACAVCGLQDGIIRVIDYAEIEKSNWIDGVTGDLVADQIMTIISHYGIEKACIDNAYGGIISDKLGKRVPGLVHGINFGGGATKERKEDKHKTALDADNKRAEMYLDLNDLMEHCKLTFTQRMADVLAPQMMATREIRKENGKTAIIGKSIVKSAIGHSPDELDATILSVHACILSTMRTATFIYKDDEKETEG